jgi:hypothetical protein
MDDRNDALRFLWSRLTPQVLHQYAENSAKLRLIECGLEAYSAEANDRGIDCLVRYAPGRFLEVHVQATRNRTRVSIDKALVGSSPERIEARLRGAFCVAFFSFEDGREPEMYLIPGHAWLDPNPCLVDNNDTEDGLPPRFEINPSENYQSILDKYRFGRRLLAGIIRTAQNPQASN